MRRFAPLTLALLLSGCGYNTWWNPSFSAGFNPNLPLGDSETLQRVQGLEPSVPELTTEAGDIWPGPSPMPPTLADIEARAALTPLPEASMPGFPLNRGTAAPYPSPNPRQGSSTPPGNAQPGLATPQPAPPASGYASPPAAPPAPGPAGQVIQTPRGPAVTTGGGPGYRTTTSPDGAQAIIVPNGNGTSTVIHPDGRIETIPTPK